MANPTFLSDGHTPRRTDPRWAIQQKILGALIDNGSGGSGGGGGGSSDPEVLGGSTDPTNSLTVSGRAIYLRSADVSGDKYIYVKNSTASNNTDWEQVMVYQ